MAYQADLPEDAWERRDEPEMHEIIVLAHWDLVCLVAGKMRQSMPEHVDEEDLRQYGVLGLMRAIKHYDPDAGAFSKYATNSIRGVILDELRSLDWAPRSLRKRQREMRRAERDLRAELGREPTTQEIAEYLKWTTSDVDVTRRQVLTSIPKSLDELRGPSETDLYNSTGVEDDLSPIEEDRGNHLTTSMSEYIASLPEVDRSVVVMVYYLGLKASEVSSVLGLPESQVRQMHEDFLDRVYERLQKLLRGEQAS